MTIEPPTTPDRATPQPREPISTGTTSALGALSGEMMVMISGVIILGVYLIFGLIADEWYPSFLSVVAATFIVIIPRMKAGSLGSGIGIATTQKTSVM